MYNICIRLTANREDAEDVLQDAFILALAEIGKLKKPDSFGSWLKKIVVHECLRFCKKQMVREKFNNTHETENFAFDDDWWINVSMQDIHHAIKSLPLGCRLVFVLYALENYSHKQVAHALEISEGTSKSQYHRARALLQQIIIKKFETNGQV